MITNIHFVIFVSYLKPNFTKKYFTNNIIKQVIDQFRFKLRLNNTPINHDFESSEVDLFSQIKWCITP